MKKNLLKMKKMMKNYRSRQRGRFLFIHLISIHNHNERQKIKLKIKAKMRNLKFHILMMFKCPIRKTKA